MYSEYAVALPSGQFLTNVTLGSEKPLPSSADEIITPEQFFIPASDSIANWTGERRLLLAVLEEAVATFIRYKDATTTRGKRLFREVREWFGSNERNYVCAFESICDHLSLDPDYVRSGLASLQSGGRRQPRAMATSGANIPWRATA